MNNKEFTLRTAEKGEEHDTQHDILTHGHHCPICKTDKPNRTKVY